MTVKEEYVKMGRDASKILCEYYGKSLVKFIKGEPLAEGEVNGGMFFSELKKHYDQYGYSNFNDALIYLYNLEKKENKNNE